MSSGFNMDDLSALRIVQSFEPFGNRRLQIFYVISSRDENDNRDVLFGYIFSDFPQTPVK